MNRATTHRANLVLITGGNGKTGRRVAERLQTFGVATRLASRSTNPAFDWDNRATWAAALQDVSAVYVTYQPDLAVPGAVAIVDAFFKQAVAAGVKKIVLLSGRGEEEAEQAERALQAIDIDWTILRASWFCQNFSESFFLEPIMAGEVALPLGLAAEPFIDAEDIAEIAAAAFVDARHTRQLYEISGPQAITFTQAIADIAKAAGRNIAVIPVSVTDYRAELIRQQVPADYVELIMYLFTHVLDGRNTVPADGVQRALSRAPRSFADYVRDTAATGIWSAVRT